MNFFIIKLTSLLSSVLIEVYALPEASPEVQYEARIRVQKVFCLLIWSATVVPSFTGPCKEILYIPLSLSRPY